MSLFEAKRVNLPILRSLIVLLTWASASLWAITPPNQAGLQSLNGEVQDLSFTDSLTQNGRQRAYRLYRNPQALQKLARKECLPTLYFFHGVAGTHQSYPFLLNQLDSLSQNPDFPALQLVQLNGNVGHATASFYTNSSLFGPFYTLISEKFPQIMRSQHQACSDPSMQFAMGHSMGAYGVSQLMTQNPQDWGGFIMHSGPLDLEDIQSMKHTVLEEHAGKSHFDPTSGKFSFMAYCMSGAFSPNTHRLFQVDLPFSFEGEIRPDVLDQWREHSPLHQIRRSHVDLLLNRGIWIDVGNADHLGVAPGAERLHQKLYDLGISHYFEVYSGGHGDRLHSRFRLSLLYITGKL